MPSPAEKDNFLGLCVGCRVPAPVPAASPFALRSGPFPGASRVRATASHRAGSAFEGGPAGLAAWSGGQRPGAVPAGQPPPDQVAQVQRGGAAPEPGVVLCGAAVAELEPASPPGGDLGDGAFHVGPAGHVVLAQPGGGPVSPRLPEQVVALVQDELAAG